MIVIGCTSEYTEQVSTPTMIIEPTQILTEDSRLKFAQISVWAIGFSYYFVNNYIFC